MSALLIALAIGLTLASAVLSVTASLQRAVTAHAESVQVEVPAAQALYWLADALRQAGSRVPPPSISPQTPLAPPLSPILWAQQGIAGAGHRLFVIHESRTDCLGSSRVLQTPYHDPSRQPPTLTQTNVYFVSPTATGGSSLMCDVDGPGNTAPQAFASQIRGLWLRFQLHGRAGWHSPASVSDWTRVRAVEICLLLLRAAGTKESCPGDSEAAALPAPTRLVSHVILRNAGQDDDQPD